jgi:hypothetical protein
MFFEKARLQEIICSQYVCTGVTGRISMNVGDENVFISPFFPYSTLYLISPAQRP